MVLIWDSTITKTMSWFFKGTVNSLYFNFKRVYRIVIIIIGFKGFSLLYITFIP